MIIIPCRNAAVRAVVNFVIRWLAWTGVALGAFVFFGLLAGWW